MAKYQSCKDCTKRFVDDTKTCHATCEDYKKFVEENERVKAERKKSKRLYVDKTTHVANIFRKEKK